MEIEVGDYVRLKSGIIGQVVQITNYSYVIRINNGAEYAIGSAIRKHSKNIIDLIEVEKQNKIEKVGEEKMIYKAENIDTDKFLEHINWLKKYDMQKEQIEKIKIEQYHEGYREAMENVENMFYCSNYEKTTKNSVEKVEG